MKGLTIAAIASATLLSGQLDAYAGLLYEVHSGSPFATFIARKPGDLLTLVIREKAITEDTGKRKRERSNDVSAKLTQFFLPPFNAARGLSATAAGGDSPELAWETETTFDAKSDSSSKHTFETKLQIRLIEEILPGQFMVRGYRTINLNGKDRQIMVNGVIRQRDIDSDNNSIESHQLADAHIEIIGETADDDVHEGFLQKMINKIF